jgi:drug/metabolite transporter (DMT)-like permease
VATTFAGSYTIVYWSEQWVPSALAAVLFATFPVWALLLGRWLLPSGAVRRRELAGASVGLAGILLLFGEDLESLSGSGVTQAAGVLLLAPVLSALGSVAVKRWGQNISPLSITAVPMLWTGAVVGTLSLFVEGPGRWSWQLKPWLATLYLSFVGSALSFVLYFRLLERRSLFVASALALTIPLVAVHVGVFFLQEPWSERMTIGTSCILAGVILGSWRPVEAAQGS